MKYRVLVTTLVLALATLGSVAVADTTAPVQIVTGKVISSTPTQLIVEADNGSRTTFVVDSSTIPSTIMVGDRVSVNYQSQAGGSFRATNVSATSLSNTKASDATGVNSNDSSTNDATSMAAVPTSGSAYPANAESTYPTDSTTNTGSYNTSTSTTTDTSASTLPATASNQPLILLLGLLALGGFLLRTVTRA